MSSILYPTIVPTKVSFTTGSINVAEASLYETDTYRTGLGTIPHGSILELNYTNIDDTEAVQLLRVYRNTYNRLHSLTLDALIIPGVFNTQMVDRIINPLGLKWFFKGEIAVDSIFKGVSSLDVTLEALIVGPF